MSCSQIVTSIGLGLDITGALLVAKDYWAPPITSIHEKNKEGFDTTAQGGRIQEQIKNYPYARCGLLFLIAGFCVQLYAQLFCS